MITSGRGASSKVPNLNMLLSNCFMRSRDEQDQVLGIGIGITQYIIDWDWDWHMKNLGCFLRIPEGMIWIVALTGLDFETLQFSPKIYIAASLNV